MDKLKDTLKCQEPDLIFPDYDIDDVKLSIQETVDAIEKIIFERSVETENKI